jgi:hypothetical protein
MLIIARLTTAAALLASAAVVAFAVANSAHAQIQTYSGRGGTYQTVPLGNGNSVTYGPNGYVNQHTDMGNGFSTDNESRSYTSPNELHDLLCRGVSGGC